jgi:hypothetical protein
MNNITNTETQLEKEAKAAKTAVSNFSLRSEKTSWMRKRNNLEQFILNNVTPIEEQIKNLQVTLFALFDEMNEKRKEMVDTCIHPFEELSYDPVTKTVRCTFCNHVMVARESSNNDSN